MTKPRNFAIAVLAASLLLAGCDTWFGETEGPPLPGQRISVLVYEGGLEPDPQLAGQPVSLGSPVRNSAWPQAGGGPLHAIGHAEGPSTIGRAAWHVDAGTPGPRSDAVVLQYQTRARHAAQPSAPVPDPFTTTTHECYRKDRCLA